MKPLPRKGDLRLSRRWRRVGGGFTAGVLAAASLVMAPGLAEAQDVVAAADSYVRGGSFAGDNYGTESALVVKTDTSLSDSFTRWSYVKFDLSGVSSVSDAKLRVFIDGINDVTFPVEARAVADTAWSETGITWNNKPVTGAVQDTRTLDLSLAGTWVEFDVTSHVASKAGGLASLALVAPNRGTGFVTFQSRENTNKPQLTITGQQPPPEDEFFVDPVNGSPTGNGSSEDPWLTIEQVVADGHFGTTIGAGDTVWLLTGYHGEFILSGGSYATPITVAAAAGADARLKRVALSDTSGWVVRGLSVSPEHAGVTQSGSAIQVAGSDITVEDNEIFTVDDASGWTATDWVSTAGNGIFTPLGSSDITMRNNVIRNVRFGISQNASNSLVEGNVIDGFSADGIRAIGEFSTYEGNVIKNSYVNALDGDPNHDDGIQSWSLGPGGAGTGEIRGVIIRGNIVINYEDPDRPLTSPLEGLGFYDGMYVDWIVENNLIISRAWNGIVMMGATNVRIVNNTVIDVDREANGVVTFIRVENHKNGTPTTGVTVRNNLAPNFVLGAAGVTADHNLEFTAAQKNSLFVDAWLPLFDAHLVSGAAAIDAGSASLAPPTDIEGTPRPQGTAVDIGAYEWTQ